MVRIVWCHYRVTRSSAVLICICHELVLYLTAIPTTLTLPTGITSEPKSL